MARTRSIKPGYFTNEELASCRPLARILFAGLWCVADRDGRLEDRPKRIKAETLPYDDCDVNELLAELDSKGFIVRYTIGGAKFIEIPNFKSHQRPHKETASKIPPRQELAPTPQKYGQDPEKSGQHPDLSGNALRAFPPSTLPPFHPSTLSCETEKPPGDDPPFDESVGGLAAAWKWYYRGSAPSQARLDEATKTFSELLRQGVPGRDIDAEIRRPDRRRTEALFQIEQRLLKQRGHHDASGNVGPSSRVRAKPGKYENVGEAIGAGGTGESAGGDKNSAAHARSPP